jgi:hypothetical protein
VRNGEEIAIDKTNLDPRMFGLEYLEEVKAFTSKI